MTSIGQVARVDTRAWRCGCGLADCSHDGAVWDGKDDGDAIMARWISPTTASHVKAGQAATRLAANRAGTWCGPHGHWADNRNRCVYVTQGESRSVPHAVWRDAEVRLAFRDEIAHVVAEWPGGISPHSARTWERWSDFVSGFGRAPDGINSVIRPGGTVSLVNGAPRMINREVGPRDPDGGLARPLVHATQASRAASVAFPDRVPVTPASARRVVASVPRYVNPLADVYAARIVARYHGMIPPRVHGMI
jgi:hypothetical protein